MGSLASFLRSLNWHSFTLFASLVVGAILRFVGIAFDLPLITHPDEHTTVKAVVDLFVRRSFEPHTFIWPGHTVIMAGYLSATLYSYLVLGMRPEAAIEMVGIEHWYLSSRILVALVGIATIALAYAIGRQFNRGVGAVAAVLFAVYPTFVMHSHYATTDMTLTALVMVVIFFAIQYLKTPRLWLVIAMSFAVALAVATKYPGLIAAGMIAIVVGIRALQDKRVSRFFGHGLLSLLAFPVSLFVVSPKLFTERGMVLRSVANESRTDHTGADGLGYLEKLGFYASDFFSGEAWLLVLPFLIGLVVLVRSGNVRSVPLFTGLLFWLSISALGLHWARWGLPMFVTPLLVSSVGIDYLFRVAPRWLRQWPRLATAIFSGLSVVTVTNLGIASLAGSTLLLATDTRVIAAQEFERLGITERNSVFEGYTVHAPNFPKRIFNRFDQTDTAISPVSAATEYAVTSSAMVNRYIDNPDFPERQQFYSLLQAQYPVVAKFKSRQVGAPSLNPLVNIPQRVISIVANLQGETVKGPTITVYRIR